MNTAQLLLLAVYLCLVLEAWNHRSPLKSKEAPYAHEAGALVRAMCGRERRDCKAYVRRDCSISYAMGRICHFFSSEKILTCLARSSAYCYSFSQVFRKSNFHVEEHPFAAKRFSEARSLNHVEHLWI